MPEHTTDRKFITKLNLNLITQRYAISTCKTYTV
jgi:hypothetical protein